MIEQAEVEIVHLMVVDAMADWEPGYAAAGINQPMFQARPGRYTIRTVGVGREPVRTMGGMTLLPDMALDDLDPKESAMLILPGGQSWEQGHGQGAVEKAGAFLDAEVPVAAICGATWGLACGGILDARPHTSNGREYLKVAPGYAGSARYVDSPAVRADGLITANGTAPLDFARCIFEELELYTPDVLQAWYALYSRGDASAFEALMAAGGGGGAE